MGSETGALLFAEVSAVNAEVEAMKAENKHRSDCGEAQAYGEESFIAMRDEILFIINKYRG